MSFFFKNSIILSLLNAPTNLSTSFLFLIKTQHGIPCTLYSSDRVFTSST